MSTFRVLLDDRTSIVRCEYHYYYLYHSKLLEFVVGPSIIVYILSFRCWPS